jgi:tetratricopeptide (TPR) repeat protein
MTSRILLLSAYPPGIHQYEIERALRAQGHQVFTAGPANPQVMPGYGAALQKRAPSYRYDLETSANTPLASILPVCPFQPDFILYLESALAFLPPDITAAPCPTLALLTEDHLHADWNSALFPYFDLVLATWKRSVDTYRAQGHDNIVQWYFGARPSWSADPDLERKHDLAFIGNLNPRVQRDRNRTLERILKLTRDGLKVFVGTDLYFEDYNRVLNESKLVYHESITGQINLRVFEAMAAGCLVIMPRPVDPTDPSSHLFVDGEEILYCDSTDEGIDLIRYYADPAHDAERRRIAEAGRRRVYAEGNYEDRTLELTESLVPRLAPALQAARGERLQRHGKDARRRHLDFAWYFTLFGAFEAARQEVLAMPNVEHDPDGLHTLGVIQAAANQPGEARRFFEAALTLAPDAHLARVNLASVAMSAKEADWDDLTNRALAAIESDARAEVPSSRLEGPYFPFTYDRFRLEVSAAYYRHPSGPERGTNLARLYAYRLHQLAAGLFLDQGQPDTARLHIDAALDVVPDDGYLLHLRGRADLALEAPQDAVRDFRAAADLEPFFAQAWWDLAEALLRLGRLEDAFAAQRELTDRSPGYTLPRPVLRRMADLALHLHHFPEAHTATQLEAQQAPDDAELRGRLAVLQAVVAGSKSTVAPAELVSA